MELPYTVEDTGIVILSDTGKKTKYREKIVLCRCHCGKEFESKSSAIKYGRTKSCGCSRQSVKHDDIIGKTFGHLTVVKFLRREKSRPVYYCSCDCGGGREASRDKLLKGTVLSGCFWRAVTLRRTMRPSSILSSCWPR